MKRDKTEMRDRMGDLGRVTGYSLDAMATRLYGRRCNVMRAPCSDTGTVYLSDGRVIGQVAIYE